MKKNIHVVPQGKKWEVKPEGLKAISWHYTQVAAINAAKPIAQKNESELVIHRPDGTIRDKNSYGHDPFPPQG